MVDNILSLEWKITVGFSPLNQGAKSINLQELNVNETFSITFSFLRNHSI